MNYTEMESKVREATNDDAWGPTGQLMQELAQATFSYEYFPEVMSMLWRRMLIDNQSNWRRTYKALIVLNYIVKNGAERAVTSTREHIYDLKGLENYTYIDENGKDCGVNVRHRVKQLIEFIQNDDALREERKKAKKNRDKYVGVSSDGTSFGSANIRFNNSFSDSPRYDEELGFRSSSSSDANHKSKTESTMKSNINDKDEEKSSSEITNGSKKSNSKTTSSPSLTQKTPSSNDAIKTLSEQTKTPSKPNPVIDLLSDLTMDNDNQDLSSLNFNQSSPVPKNVESMVPTKSADQDLKEIVKNIDIFSSKRQRPTKSNKSNIPDLTSKNPNPSFSASGKKSSNQNDMFALRDDKIAETTHKVSPKNIDVSLFETNNNPSSSSQIFNSIPTTASSPLDEFNLLSISKPQVDVKSVGQSQVNTTTILTSQSTTKKSSSTAIDDLTSLNLITADDPFGLNQMNIMDESKSGMGNTPLAPESNMMNQSASSQVKSSASGKSSALPATWDSLVAGTKFNLDLDNLMSPDGNKGAKPSLNQLAKKKIDNDDLFG